MTKYVLLQILGLMLMLLGINDAVTLEYGSIILTMPMGGFFFILGTFKNLKKIL